jgi:hypothetical protein
MQSCVQGCSTVEVPLIILKCACQTRSLVMVVFILVQALGLPTVTALMYYITSSGIMIDKCLYGTLHEPC